MVLAVVHATGKGIPSVAGHVVGQHEDDVRVWDPQAPHGVVDGEGVSNVSVVEPEARGTDLWPSASAQNNGGQPAGGL